MLYRDELVLTGQLNDVGAQTRVNVPRSYRTGIELNLDSRLAKALNYSGSLSVSRSILPEFEAYVDDWDEGGQLTILYKHSPTAFSPGIVASSELRFDALQAFGLLSSLELSLIGKYVGRQYLDNTGDKSRSLAPYGSLDFRLNYKPRPAWAQNLSFIFLLRNLTNQQYAANGWVYTYQYEGRLQQMDGLYPQAGINYMLGMSIEF